MGHGRDLNELQEVFCRYEFHCANRRWLYVKKLCKGNIGQFQMSLVVPRKNASATALPPRNRIFQTT